VHDEPMPRPSPEIPHCLRRSAGALLDRVDGVPLTPSFHAIECQSQ
jgi:hypothetical protein